MYKKLHEKKNKREKQFSCSKMKFWCTCVCRWRRVHRITERKRI